MNMIDKIYIIGNGFDVHHGIKSSYKQYLEWLRCKYIDVYKSLLEFYPQAKDPEWWGEFEENLGFPIMGDYLDDVITRNQPSEDNKRGFYDKTGGAQDVHEELGEEIKDIRKMLHEWIASLNPPLEAKKLKIDTANSKFLNFNYTKTLEKIYNIEDDKILYIHGCVNNKSGELVLGHGEDEKSITETVELLEYDDKNIPLRQDLIRANTNEAAINEICSLRKNVEQIIANYKGFFDSLKNVKEVFFFGISFSPIDSPYFQKIVESVSNNANYTISYFSEKDYKKVRTFIKDNNIKSYKLIELESLEIHKSIIPLF